jgi:flagellar hook-basal body complex protein FliE
MINPLDALSALQSTSSSVGALNFQPTGPAAPTNAISEGFNNLLQPAQATQATAPVASLGSGGASPTTWGHMIQQMVMDVNSQQQTAAQKVTDVLKGGPTPVHEAMVASEEASLSFEFLSEMRNKVVESYQQIMQMQV